MADLKRCQSGDKISDVCGQAIIVPYFDGHRLGQGEINRLESAGYTEVVLKRRPAPEKPQEQGFDLEREKLLFKQSLILDKCGKEYWNSMARLIAEVERLKAENATYFQEHSQGCIENHTLKQELKALRQQCDTATSDRRGFVNERNAAWQRIEELKAELATLNKTAESDASSLHNVMTKFFPMENQLKETTHERDHLKRELSDLRSELRDLVKELQS